MQDRLAQLKNELYRFTPRARIALALLFILCCALQAAPLFAPRAPLTFTSRDITVHEGDTASYILENVTLQKGIYEVSCVYDAGAHLTLTAEAAAHPSAITSERVILSMHRHASAFRLYVNDHSAQVRLVAKEQWAANNAHFHQFTFLYQRRMSVLYRLLATAWPFLLLTAALLLLRCYRERLDTEGKRIAAGLALVVLLINIPLFLPYVPYGGDLALHMSRIARLGDTLRSGAFPVRLQTGWYMDYGYPVSVFYGDLFLYPPALLYLCGVPLFHCYRLYVFAVNLLAVTSSYLCFRRISGNRTAALLGSALYATGTYYLINLYQRAALGEFSAMAFLPFVLLGFFLLMRDEKKDSMRYLVLGFTGLIETHLITSVQAALFAALFCVCFLRALLKNGRIVTLVKSAALCAAVNAAFLIPLIDYYLKCDVVAGRGGDVAPFATTIAQWFMTESNPAGMAGDLAQGIAGDMPQTCGLALLFAVILSLFHAAAGGFASRRREAQIAAVFSLLSLFLTTDLFPYGALQKHLPLLYSLLGKNIYYPFRYFTMVTLFASFLAVLLYLSLQENGTSKKAGTLLAACLVVLSCVQGVTLISRQLNAAGPFLALDGTGTAFEGDGMYVPQGAVLDDARGAALTVPDAPAALQIRTQERQGLRYQAEAENVTTEDVTLVFPLWHFPYYTATGNGEPLPVSETQTKQIAVQIPAGFAGQIVLSWQAPVLWRCAEGVSVLAAAGFLYLLFRKKAIRAADHSEIQS